MEEKKFCQYCGSPIDSEVLVNEKYHVQTTLYY